MVEYENSSIKCGICGKQVDITSYRAYTSKCGNIIRCFEHADVGIKGYPDFGQDYCGKCGEKLSVIKLSERKNGYYCGNCRQMRSGRNIRHVHGKDCIKRD